MLLKRRRVGEKMDINHRVWHVENHCLTKCKGLAFAMIYWKIRLVL